MLIRTATAAGCVFAATTPLLAQAPAPLETILVVGSRPTESAPLASALEPNREGRLSTLKDLFATAPGVIVEPVFGGVDHPRFAIRGSGLQRGTMPAGRGIELRLDGLPMTYADTSFDFVEWIEPLSFQSVNILRGGRGASAGATALGGVVDFRSRTGQGPLTLLGRGEAGSFGNARAQAAVSGEAGPGSAFVSGSWFRQDGFRAHNSQDAKRATAVMQLSLAPGIALSSGLLWSDSSLKLPGPQTLAQIAAGDRSAQPGNVAGDWKRDAARMRAQLGVDADLGATSLALSGAFMATDVMFRRRDVLDEANADWTVKAGARQQLGGNHSGASIGAELLWQRGDRNAKQWLNGGGTIPSFSGARGRLWADNDFLAERLSLTAILAAPIGDMLRADIAAGGSRHLRRIDENFATRAARPAATLDRTYSGFHGLASLTATVAPGLDLFGAVSRVMEPPTFDLLFTNVAGTGSGNALIGGANPRRPIVNNLNAQFSTTIELGAKGRIGPVDLDFTLYRSWLTGEFVSTADFVSQMVSSVGNADQTRRWGVEAALDARLASPGLQAGDALTAIAQWTWTDARFADDPVFGNRRLPILPPHVVGLGLAYAAPTGLSGAVFAQIVPTGGYVDYAQTLQAGGYAVLGARASTFHRGFTLFVEGRNLTNRRYASTVIAAQNNVGGQDRPAFAPGEGRAIFGGIELALQPR